MTNSDHLRISCTLNISVQDLWTAVDRSTRPLSSHAELVKLALRASNHLPIPPKSMLAAPNFASFPSATSGSRAALMSLASASVAIFFKDAKRAAPMPDGLSAFHRALAAA
mmetsp:Transcript_103081/g.183159  ORF Transcript_103081/g.183159 Transcript_103081/m.183159 type:complete len:111 (+) Transcript_103081:172-504(+)